MSALTHAPSGLPAAPNRGAVGSLPRSRAMLLPRMAAAAAVLGAGAHCLLAVSMAGSPVESLGESSAASAPMVIMALVMAASCLPCAVGLWRRCSRGSARMLMLMSLAMVVIHGAMLLGLFSGVVPMNGMAMNGMAHGQTGSPGGEMVDGGMAVQTVGIMAIEYAAALLAAVWLFRGRKGPQA